jgi:hypothetical protein
MAFRVVRGAFVLGVALIVVACSSTPKKPAEGMGMLFNQPIDAVRTATANALAVHGFNIEEQTDTYLRGSRPRKIGFFVGSGGETVGIWLDALDEGRTRVMVSTAKSFVGYAGQKNWDDDIYFEIRQDLTKADLEKPQT